MCEGQCRQISSLGANHKTQHIHGRTIQSRFNTDGSDTVNERPSKDVQPWRFQPHKMDLKLSTIPHNSQREQLGKRDSLTNKERPLERVLGVKWKPDTDVFLVDAKKFHAIDKKDLTQRKLLKFASSIFDPLGITMPLTIQLRQSLQLAWSNGPQWDTPLNMEHLTDLDDWIDKRSQFNDICMPQIYFKPETKILETQLHVFSDASELALASVAYLRIGYDDDTTELKFVIGNARVAPISRMTIPNLELQAATNELNCLVSSKNNMTYESTVRHYGQIVQQFFIG